MSSAKNKGRKNKKRQNDQIQKRFFCESCETPLTFKGGYAQTGLCGVCACGEASMLDERGETW